MVGGDQTRIPDFGLRHGEGIGKRKAIASLFSGCFLEDWLQGVDEGDRLCGGGAQDFIGTGGSEPAEDVVVDLQDVDLMDENLGIAILGVDEDLLDLGKALAGMFKGLYRYRYGDYRVIYAISRQEIIITIVRVSFRRDAYL